MRSVPILRLAAIALILPLLSACAGGATASGPGAAATPKADYSSYSDQFAALQSAGLKGDYPGFARHLKTADTNAVVTQLRQNFRGKPFDVYTRKADLSDASHKRLVELRSSDGRLYLFMKLDKVPGGWVVAGYEMGRNQTAISAKL